MKTFLSAQDIEAMARQGQRELVIDGDTVLTDLARDAAAHLGLRLVAPGRAGEPAAAARPAAPAAPRASAMPALAAKPRGCQPGPSGAAPAPGASRAANGKVLDDLAGVVKQMSKS